VKFALYSDGSESVARNIRRAIQKGLSTDDALRALTLTPAEIYGVADRIGSIEKGKIANLVVVKGDLFAERPQIQHVFVDGVRYDPPPPAAAAKPEVTQ
jgi:imidazolonepropionase-like amidohydrolase